MSTQPDAVNILMVDDQPAKLLSYEVILKGLGANLIKANSAREALEQLLKYEIAVVLVDVSMPELDGFELAAMIRQHPRFETTAIIFISAVLQTDLRHNDLTLDVPEGSIYGFIGPNGSGKTTTIRMIMNIILPDRGDISVLGQRTSTAARDAVGPYVV